MKGFGENIALIRDFLGLKQKEVAEKVEVGRNTLSDYENNKSEPNFTTLLKFSELYDTPIDIFFFDNAYLKKFLEELKNQGKSIPKRIPNCIPKYENMPILEEPAIKYGVKNLEQVIQAQQHTIDSQKALIDSLNEHIQYLKGKEKMN